MFTGLVESIGTLREFTDTAGGRTLRVEVSEFTPEIGESIAVNGCCLTVSGFSGDEVRFDLLAETLRRTNLGALSPGSRLNLERALAANGRLGGHFVQGHIDCTTALREIREAGSDLGLFFGLPPGWTRYVVFKGSIAVNGVSLTVADLAEDSFGVWIIPHTCENTNLGDLRVGDAVNIEFDLLAKYTERLLASR